MNLSTDPSKDTDKYKSPTMTRHSVLNDAQKRRARRMFKPYDPDQVDTDTEDESETERLTRYGRRHKPSPRKTAALMRQQLRETTLHELHETSSNQSQKRLLKEEMSSEEREPKEARRAFMAVVQAQKPQLEDQLKKLLCAPKWKEEAEDPGTGRVVCDSPLGPSAHYLNYQRVRSKRIKREHERSDRSPPPELGKMGLFAQLPGELRNRIYGMALVEGDGASLFIAMRPKTCSQGPCEHMKLPTAVPGILSASKQIRAESMPIYLAENSFKFDHNLVRERCVPNWLRVLGPYGALVSSIALEIRCWEEEMVEGKPTKVTRTREMLMEWQPKSRMWTLRMPHKLKSKAREACQKLREQMLQLQVKTRCEGVPMEVALLEFVWGDWLANVVYLCKK